MLIPFMSELYGCFLSCILTHTTNMKDFAEGNKTVWDCQARDYPTLNRDIETDIGVVGGGLAGLAAAYTLTERGYKVAVIEGNRVGRGQSLGSSAIVTYAHDAVYYRLIKKYGLETAKKYFRLQADGLTRIREIVKRESIDCGFEDRDFVLFAETKKGEKELLKELEAYKKMGVDSVGLTEDNEAGYNIRCAIKIKKQACLDPYKFCIGLAEAIINKGGLIFENSFVKSQPENNAFSVNGHTVSAKKIIMATHFPYVDFPGFYFFKMYQHRSHSIVFKSDLFLKNMYESADAGGFELRDTGKNSILCLGANIRTGKYNYRSQYAIVEEHIKEKFSVNESDITHRFGAQDCMTADLLPYAGAYSPALDDALVVSGFNKWGFTNAFACADILNRLIKKEEFVNILDTKRFTFIINAGQNLKNLGEILLSFFALLIMPDKKKLKRIDKGQGAVIRHGFKRIGVYRTENGKLIAVKAVCPHLGCALKYNKDERTWDCPCHGSRFDTEGKLIIAGPALRDLERFEELI